MDFAFSFAEDYHKKNSVLVFVTGSESMVQRSAVPESITAQGHAPVFIEAIVRLHSLPHELVSDDDPRFTAEF